MALSVDCSILEELKATNYSLLVLVCPGLYVRTIDLYRSWQYSCVSFIIPALHFDTGFSLVCPLRHSVLLSMLLPARGEVDEMNYAERSPKRPPYIRLDGQDCTLFAVSTLNIYLIFHHPRNVLIVMFSCVRLSILSCT